MKLSISLFTLVLLLFSVPQVSAQPTKPPTVKQIKKVQLRAETQLELTKRLPFIDLTVPLILSKNTNGRTGFYLKRVGGAQLMANDKSFAFYPASTIKVLEHLHAMRRVQNGLSIDTDINIWGDPCSDNHEDESPETQEDLSESLRKMMKDSDNKRTNAIQDRFGRTAINNTAHQVVGMSSATQLNHKFGCQGPASNPANRLTLVDVGKLYEGVANGSLLSGTSRQTFYDLMRNQSDAFFIESVIDAEATNLGVSNTKRDNFKAQVKTATKSGGVPAGYDGFLYESTAGYVSLPFAGVCTAAGFALATPREYVYGVFINKATKIADGTVSTAASELFKGEIREALKSWKKCPSVRVLTPVPRPQLERNRRPLPNP